MKFALITPPQGAELLHLVNLGYHFVLAQYLSDPAYRRMYQTHVARGHFIMMDNGAAELGKSIGIARLVALAHEMRVDEVVMPDALDDHDTTLRLTTDALLYIPERMRAFCPQGTSWAEWEDCAEKMVAMGGATLCIAKRYEKLPGGRPHALKLIRIRGWDDIFNVHLLGVQANPIAEILAARKVYSEIRGIDTAAPFAYAQIGKPIDGPVHCSVDWYQDFDYGEVVANVDKCLEACDAYNFTE